MKRQLTDVNFSEHFLQQCLNEERSQRNKNWSKNMENKSNPSYAIPVEGKLVKSDAESQWWVSDKDGIFNPKQEHLDIRTHLASLMMQGLISHYGGSNPESNAKMAVENADALIAKLNETN